jgi:hypothetical protein
MKEAARKEPANEGARQWSNQPMKEPANEVTPCLDCGCLPTEVLQRWASRVTCNMPASYYVD